MGILKQSSSAICIALAITLAAGTVRAQDYPARPIRIISGFGPGSAGDMLARIVSQKLGPTLGQQLIIEHKPGGGSTVAADQIVRGPKDGYTLFMGTVANVINAVMQPNLAFDFSKDFAPIAYASSSPNILVVHPSTGVTNVKELIALLKAKPEQIFYGSSGVGTSPHLSGELFNMMAGTKMVHVPFRSSGDVMNALVGGHIDLAFDNITLAWPQVKAGTMRALAVTSAQPSATAPEVPPVAATLSGFEATSWHGLFAPAGTPRPVVDALAGEVKRIFEQPEVQKSLNEVGAVPSPMTPAEFTEFISSERRKWQAVVQAAGVEVQ